jgi:hypothetical protein
MKHIIFGVVSGAGVTAAVRYGVPHLTSFFSVTSLMILGAACGFVTLCYVLRQEESSN